jgi:formiminoglutamase
MAYEGLEKLITVLNVDAFLDMEESDQPEQTHIHNMLVYEPNYLFHYSHLAYQSYLIEKTSINVLERLYFETYRLGHLRELLKDMEPVIREADMLSFDISAIRSSDAPGSNNAQPFGLSGEEACQICWYAGQNEKLSSAGFYEYNPTLDDSNHKTASVIATMVWYFLEGVNRRKGESASNVENYTKYVVEMRGGSPASIVFYKSKVSERWWMEIPLEDKSVATFGRNSLAPCSYSDYETAANGEVPDRYIQMLSRLN